MNLHAKLGIFERKKAELEAEADEKKCAIIHSLDVLAQEIYQALAASEHARLTTKERLDFEDRYRELGSRFADFLKGYAEYVKFTAYENDKKRTSIDYIELMLGLPPTT